MGGNVVGRRQLIGLPLAVLGVAACGTTSAVEGPFPPQADAGTTPDAPLALPPPSLQPPGAAPLFPIGTRFYSWTTAEQAAELRATRKLFTRAERPGQGAGHLMNELARIGSWDLTAKAAAGLTLGRYAWTHAWSTAAGFMGEEYGGELIEMVVRPDSQFVHFVSYTSAVRVVDVAGNDVQLDASRVVGATHCNGLAQGTFRCTPRGTAECAPYREVYLGNSAQIASWSLGTAALRDVIAGDIAKLRTWASTFPETSVDGDDVWYTRILGAMGSPVTEPDAYLAQLAFGDPAYRDLAPRTRALIAILESRLFEPTNPLVVAG